MGIWKTFGIQKNHADEVFTWLNKQLPDKNSEISLYGHDIATQNFGDFEMMSWKGDLQLIRKTLRQASKKFRIKIIEGAYRQSERTLRIKKYDYALVRNGNKVVGHLEFSAPRFRKSFWQLNKEERR